MNSESACIMLADLVVAVTVQDGGHESVIIVTITADQGLAPGRHACVTFCEIAACPTIGHTRAIATCVTVGVQNEERGLANGRNRAMVRSLHASFSHLSILCTVKIPNSWLTDSLLATCLQIVLSRRRLKTFSCSMAKCLVRRFSYILLSGII